jgi:rhodanese-related sulfurtransferase/DNA-binding transcriptional ArsR family regulator
MPTDNFKQGLFAQLARISKALGHASRLEPLEFLAQGERGVDDLARVSGLSVANTSQHLQHLRQAGLVAARKQGVKVIYRLGGADMVRLLAVPRKVVEAQVAKVHRLVSSYLYAKDGLEPVAGDELVQRASEGSVLILDVRPAEEYAAGHIAGTLSIPLKELERRMVELPQSLEIVAYCRGPYCVLAFDAVTRLRAAGHRARRLEYGFPEWQLAGLSVERSQHR